MRWTRFTNPATAKTPTPERIAVRTGTPLRSTFGPMAAGLLAGGLVALAGVGDTAWTNATHTRDHFPHIDPTAESAWPDLMVAAFRVLSWVAPVFLGVAVVWLARPTDALADAAVGITAGVTASFVAFVAVLGWQTTVAHTVVPAVGDWMAASGETLPSDGSPPAPNGPSALLRAYPELERVPAERRGNVFVAKLAADQLVGTARGLWHGAALAVLSVGAVGVVGTLAAGRWRRAGASGWRAAGAYSEMVAPAAVTHPLWGRLYFAGDDALPKLLGLACVTVAVGLWFAAAWTSARWAVRGYLGGDWAALVGFGGSPPVAGFAALAGALAVGGFLLRDSFRHGASGGSCPVAIPAT